MYCVCLVSKGISSAPRCDAKKTRKLSARHQVARAYTATQKAALLAQAKKRRSPCIYPALMLALHAGMRDAEIRGLQWGRVDFSRPVVQVSDSQTEAGKARVIPLNSELLTAPADHSKWFLGKFGETRPELYLCNACKGCRSTETIVG